MGGGAGGGDGNDDDLLAPATALDDEERFKRCSPLKLKTGTGGFDFSGVAAILLGTVDGNAALATPAPTPAASDASAAAPASAGPAAPTPATDIKLGTDTVLSKPLSGHALANQVRLAVRDAISGYYSTTLRSDDELAPCDTRNVSLRTAGGVTDVAAGVAEPGTLPADPKCQGVMAKVTTEAALYTQLVYFRRLLSVPDALARLPEKDRAAAEARVPPATVEALRLATLALDETLARSAYRWIDLSALYGAAGIAC